MVKIEEVSSVSTMANEAEETTGACTACNGTGENTSFPEAFGANCALCNADWHKAPAELVVSGADGNNAAIINGLYVVQEGLFNCRPFYRKAEDDDKFLAYMTNEFWYVTESKCKERNTPGGWLKAKGALPNSVDHWSKLKDANWEVCPKVVVKPRVEAPQPTKATCTDVMALKTKSMSVVRNPNLQTVTICGASGTLTLASIGGAFGCVSGLVVGGAVGVVPAIFTFGTSIPFGAVLGAVLGTNIGACTAGSVGAALGVAAGSAYVWRAELKEGVLHVKVTAVKRSELARLQLAKAGTAAKHRARIASDQVTDLALSTKRRGHEIVTDQRTHVTVASAAAGAAVGGTTGGAAGAVAGAGTGALVGLPAALFTFGLSVPVCAAMGGAVGCAAGAATGGTAGGAVGGAAGYNAHKYRKEIATGTTSAWGKVRARTQRLKVAAAARLGRAAPEPVAQPAC